MTTIDAKLKLLEMASDLAKAALATKTLEADRLRKNATEAGKREGTIVDVVEHIYERLEKLIG